MGDIAMNTFTPVSDVEYVYGELENGSQVKLKKSDLISLLLSLTGLDRIKIIKRSMSIGDVVSLGLKNGLYFFISEGIYGFCDLVSICKDSTLKLTIVSQHGYGSLTTTTNILSAGQHCIYINNDANQIEFRQRSATMNVTIGYIHCLEGI